MFARGLMRLVAMLLLALALAAPTAAADPALVRARQYFDSGRALYEQGRYDEAAKRFSAGYELVHRPRFLLNMGQCYRQLKALPKARELFQRYLDEAPDDDPERARVIRFIAEIDAAEARTTQAEPPVADPAPAATVAIEPTPVAPAARPSFARRNWWIFPVVGAVVAGAVVGIYFGVRPADPCANSVSCLDLR